ncbi:MAG: LysR family transcriptional regulator [Syntrophobacterales bacterium]|nr:LysR family transcriptional regulator [Syntrophobacterales bacterium]
MKIKHKIWLEANGKVIFGQGRTELLRAIDECRSLNAAAKKLNMSYRAAWGRLKASEERMGLKLAEKDASAGGMRLTDDARQLLLSFEQLEGEVASFLEYMCHKLSFPPSD